MIRLHLAVWATSPVTWLYALMGVLATGAGSAAAWTAAQYGAGATGHLPLVTIVTLTLPVMFAGSSVATALILPRRRRRGEHL